MLPILDHLAAVRASLFHRYFRLICLVPSGIAHTMQFIRAHPIISGAVAYVAGVGAVVAYKSSGPLQPQQEAGAGRSTPAQDMSHGNPSLQANVAHVYDTAAASYDDDIGKEEAVMGIPLFRRWLLRQAQGNVLEVGAGTGRNIQYYQPCPVMTAGGNLGKVPALT